MTNEERIIELGQSIYRAKNNRKNDIAAGTETDDFVADTIDWVNQFIQELEMEADWNYVRTNDYTVGTVTDITAQSYDLPATVQRLVVSPYRDLKIMQDGAIVATFRVVNPNQISDPTNPDTADRCTVLGPRNARKLVLSRPLTEAELNGTLVADVVSFMPELSLANVTLLDIVEPPQLLVLGCAKNSTLPDIVQGGISPALAQKYADLLAKAVAANNATSDAYDIPREDFGYIRGIW